MPVDDTRSGTVPRSESAQESVMATARRLPTVANPSTTVGNSAKRRSTLARRPLRGESVRLRLNGGGNDPGIEPVMNSARLAGSEATNEIDSSSMTRFGSRSHGLLDAYFDRMSLGLLDAYFTTETATGCAVHEFS